MKGRLCFRSILVIIITFIILGIIIIIFLYFFKKMSCTLECIQPQFSVCSLHTDVDFSHHKITCLRTLSVARSAQPWLVCSVCLAMFSAELVLTSRYLAYSLDPEVCQ